MFYTQDEWKTKIYFSQTLALFALIAPTTPTDFKPRQIDTSVKDTPRLIQSFMFGLLRNI